MLLLLLHWMSCVWWIVIDMKKLWLAPKDTDWEADSVFEIRAGADQGLIKAYFLLFYYSCLALFASDILPIA